ncbi:hypothetical protein M407DRAFT_54875, partial [Tulasnella calospora MUT 4182]
IKDTFDGIRYLHTRKPPICHGDLKSLNILVSSSYRAVITDFGSARTISTTEGELIGEENVPGPAWSLRWAAPEVVNGERQNLASDIWAVGWVCWEIMTNQLPFHELSSEGLITLKVIQGEVPVTRADEQLSQVVRLCSLMTDCWIFTPGDRPSI